LVTVEKCERNGGCMEGVGEAGAGEAAATEGRERPATTVKAPAMATPRSPGRRWDRLVGNECPIGSEVPRNLICPSFVGSWAQVRIAVAPGSRVLAGTIGHLVIWSSVRDTTHQ
jgi:hypothetical protein